MWHRNGSGDEETFGVGPETKSRLNVFPDDHDQDEDAPLRPPTDFDRLSSGAGTPTLQHRIPRRDLFDWRKVWNAIEAWIKGPQPPRIYKINPIFPHIQHAPIALLNWYLPRKRIWILFLFYACWLSVFSIMLWMSSLAAQIPGYSTPVRLSCLATYWDNVCGLNGDQCRPFTNASVAFRCPADCHKIQVLNPHAVGDQEVVYKPLVIGGPSNQQTASGFQDRLFKNAVYRGDSFVCASAIHSGIIKRHLGGCGVLALTGEQASFAGSRRHGIESQSFDSYFPRTFGFLSGTSTGAQCRDLRWPILFQSVTFSALLSLCTANPEVHFWSVFVALFFHVALVSDPPRNTSYYDLFSTSLGRFLPAGFCAWVIYKYAVRRSLAGLTAQIEKTVLWLGAAWVGALNNYTFDKIPIHRLTPHDIKAQPGAVPALIIIVIIILLIALGQAWAFRIEGRMPRYLIVYGLLIVTLLIMLLIPGLNLRIHHYILGLIFLPGTSFQNRRSLLYQGLLIGLFINGVARWGFASILETPASLLEGAQQNTILPSVSVQAMGTQNITFDLGSLPAYDSKQDTSYDGISVLVNDVERFRGYSDNFSGQNITWTWLRHRPKHKEAEGRVLRGLSSEEGIAAVTKLVPEYFRFGYLAGSQAGDYTKAGKWSEDGTWVEMKSGPSL